MSTITALPPVRLPTNSPTLARWRNELDAAEVELKDALYRAASLASEAVKVNHRIDELREVIERRKSNLRSYGP